MKLTFASLLALLLTPAALSAYETSFESPDFGTGGVHTQSGWTAAYSSDPDLCTIVDSADAPIPPPDGVQMLSVIRPTNDSRPAAGVIFREDPEPLLDFVAEFQLAFQARSTFPIFQVEVGSASDSSSGVHVGVSFFEEHGGRPLKFFHGRNLHRKPVPMPESSDSRPAEPLTFYHFTLRVHDQGKLFDLTVRHGDEVVAALASQPVAVVPTNYNRLIVSLPGGSQGDEIYFDALQIQE